MSRFTFSRRSGWLSSRNRRNAPPNPLTLLTKNQFLLFIAAVTFLPGCNGSTQPQFIDQAVPIRAVRVRLLEDVTRADFAVKGPYVVTDDDDNVLRRYSSSDPFQVLADKSGIVVNGWLVKANTLCIKPVSFGTVRVRDRRYRGWLRVIRNPADSKLMVVNHVPLEQYVAGVLGGELPRSFHSQTFRAQAVAARTYVLHRMLNTSRTSWDVASTAASQVYRGIDGESSKTKSAQRATHGQVLVYTQQGRHQIIITFYSSTCGGGARPAWELKDVPHIEPLGGVKIDQCQASPYHTWKETPVFTKQELHAKLAKADSQIRRMKSISKVRIASRWPHGRARDIRITDQRGRSVTVSAETVRIALGLRSTWFDIVDKSDSVSFTNGRGWGHGMGMCQFGADRLARRGYKYEEILETYYPGSELKRYY